MKTLWEWTKKDKFAHNSMGYAACLVATGIMCRR